MTVIVQPPKDSNGNPQPMVYDQDTGKVIVDSNGFIVSGGQKLVNIPSIADYINTSKTQTSGIQEANNYADIVLENIKVTPGTYLINEQINFMQHSYAIFDGQGATIKANASMTSIIKIDSQNPTESDSSIGMAQTVKNILFDGNGLAEYGLYVLSGSDTVIENVQGTGTTSYWIYISGTDYPQGIRIINANDDNLAPGASLYVNIAGGNILRLTNSTFNGYSNITGDFLFISSTLFKGLDINGSLIVFDKCYFYPVQSSTYTDFLGRYFNVDITFGNVKFIGCTFDTDTPINSESIDIITITSGGTPSGSANTISIDSCYFSISSATLSSQEVYLLAFYDNSNNSLVTGHNNFLLSASDADTYLTSNTQSYTYVNVKFTLINLTSSGTFSNNTPQPATPSVPASGTAQQNTNPYPVDVYLYGGTVTEIQITKNGTAYTVFSNSTGLALSGQAYKLNPGDSITVTYTAAPSWEWLSD